MQDLSRASIPSGVRITRFAPPRENSPASPPEPMSPPHAHPPGGAVSVCRRLSGVQATTDGHCSSWTTSLDPTPPFSNGCCSTTADIPGCAPTRRRTSGRAAAVTRSGRRCLSPTKVAGHEESGPRAAPGIRLSCRTASSPPSTRDESGGRYWVRTSDLFRVREARYHCANRPGRRSMDPRWRWVRDSNPCTRLCRPLPRLSANPPEMLPHHTRRRIRRMSSAPSPGSGRRDSNPRPSPWQGDALPTEPRPRRKELQLRPWAILGSNQ